MRLTSGSWRLARNAPCGRSRARLLPAAQGNKRVRHRYRPAVLTRRVVLLLLADLVSTTGTEMTAVALPWLVLVTTGSPLRTGLVLAAEMLGLAACGLPGGAAVQRLGPRGTLLVADAGRAAAIGLVPVLDRAGGLSFAVLLVVAFVLGAPFAAHQAAQQSALAELARDDEHQLTRLGGLLSAANEGASTVGPVLGGLLVALLGAEGVLVVDCGSYLVAVLLVAVALPAVAGPVTTAGVLDGLRWLAHDRPLRRLIGGLCVLQVSFTALVLLVPVLARTRYGGGAATAGVLLGAYGLGSVVGGLVTARARRRGPPERAVWGLALTLLPVVVTPPAWALAVCLAGHGCFSGLVYPRLFAALALRPPEALRAHVQTAATTTLSVTAPLGFLGAGLLLDGSGPTAALILVAATAVAGAGVAGHPRAAGLVEQTPTPDRRP